MKYIVVTGGVISGLGKGITTASIGRILKDRGYNVVPMKIDPYINIDAGTMNPFQHGEVYVLADGTEVDLDFGHYERFMDIELGGEHNITTGVIFLSVINRERNGEYLGQTVQIIPHVTNEIKLRIREVAARSNADICIVEIGGTVGDIESMPFLEAVRQMRREEPRENFLLIHVTLVPLTKLGEQKTKPTQHSVKALRELGLQPDIIVCRCERALAEDVKEKIAMFCDVDKRDVISAPDTDEIYEVPVLLENEGIFESIRDKMLLNKSEKRFYWENIVEKCRNLSGETEVAIVGKYAGLEDSYLSIKEAIKHAMMDLRCNVDIMWIEAEDLETDEGAMRKLERADGVLVPGGFGTRGTEGKIRAIEFARVHGKPFLGICLGFQLAVVEVARNLAGLKNANSTEFCDDTPHPVVDLLDEQRGIMKKGGTMRLGNGVVIIKENTLAHRIYGKTEIVERHRHRYEVNPSYLDMLSDAGILFSGTDSDGNKMEILELPNHPFFFATQFHPEFRSRPDRPSPPFRAFISACMRHATQHNAEEV
ncbi:MAG: CTP synthase (glutamine hydrolyzing) [Canidatus Methanoxibalbensis ujae]|nr:CTP synthase (glutamine hydrolyzing) [Candidatus Methanoxibalbensis ujae]MCW7077596.1 CTP synthase (glutamine hydrolyzing) [Candidatus Methanoxibalbensis ujae]